MWVVALGLSALLIGALLFTGLGFWLRDAVAFAPAWEPFAGWLPLRVGAYFLALFFAAFIIFEVPSALAAHRYGARLWVADRGPGVPEGEREAIKGKIEAIIGQIDQLGL